MNNPLKSVLIICLLTSINIQIKSQEISINNQRTFGGANPDWPRCAKKTTDGGFIVGGWSVSGITGDKTEYSRGSSDFWLVKFDSLLNEGWQKAIGGYKDDALSDIIVLSGGGYICVGESNSPISGDKTVANFTVDTNDYWIVKLNSVGDIIWQNVYGGTIGDAARAVIELENKSIIIGGSSSSNISGTKSEVSRGYTDYWIVNIDSAGNVLWDRTFGGSSYESLTNLITDLQGNVYISGTSMSDISGEKSENSYGGSRDIWVIKIDSLGNKLWDKTLGGSAIEAGGYISIKDNYLYVIAQSFSNISGTKTSSNKGVCDYWLTKLDTDGNIIWDKTFGGSNYDIPESMTVTSNNQILLSGGSWSGISGDKTEANKGLYDYWLVCIDTAGTIKWQKTIGGSHYDQIINTVELSPNNYLLAGYSRSNISGDKTEDSRGEEDFWLVSLDVITGITKVINQANSIIYPNPCTTTINIKTSEFIENSKIVISDISGRKILLKQVESISSQINISSLQSGIYFYNIVNNGEVIEGGKFVKE